jgi:Domain of unknown function (DUF4350)
MAGERSGRAGRISVWVAIGAGLLLIALLGGRPPGDVPFDPDSTGPSGLRGLRETLSDLGADVTLVDAPVSDDADLIAVLEDGALLSDEQTASIHRALDRGATLVVTDPVSGFTPDLSSGATAAPFGNVQLEETVGPGACDVDALDGVGDIDLLDTYQFQADDGDSTCYGTGGTAYVVVSRAGRDGRGTVVALGGTRPFTNELLDREGNAALIAAFLVPEAGASVEWVRRDPGQPGSETLADRLSAGTRQGLVQLVIAFVVLALAMGRRLGAPVVEAGPTRIGGSELVVAVGDLLQRTGSPQRAAQLIRDETRRLLCERLGLPVDTPPDIVAEMAASRTDLDHDEALDVLVPSAVSSDAELVVLAQRAAAVRQEVLHGQPT